MWWPGKDQKSFWKKSKNPWSSREFVKFTFHLSITSVEQLHLKKDFGKIQKSISCQGYPWNPWGNFFQLVTVIPWDEHQPFISEKNLIKKTVPGPSLHNFSCACLFLPKVLFHQFKQWLWTHVNSTITKYLYQL